MKATIDDECSTWPLRVRGVACLPAVRCATCPSPSCDSAPRRRRLTTCPWLPSPSILQNLILGTHMKAQGDQTDALERGRDRELASGLHILDILADEVHRGPQQNHFRAGDSAQRPIVEPRDPRHDRAVPETQHKFGVHDNVATLTHHKPDDVWGLHAKGHKVDQQYGAFAGFEARLQDQAVATVTTRDTGLRVARRDPPAPMLLPAQEC